MEYQEMLKNIREYLDTEAINGVSCNTINAFQFSEALGVALNKPKEIIIIDIINTK